MSHKLNVEFRSKTKKGAYMDLYFYYRGIGLSDKQASIKAGDNLKRYKYRTD